METGHLFIIEEAHSRAEASYSSQRGEGSQANQVGQRPHSVTLPQRMQLENTELLNRSCKQASQGGTVRTSSRTVIIQGRLKNQPFLYYVY